jgi:hypothetical protein
MNYRNYCIVVAGVFALVSQSLAGGTIYFPGNTNLPAGYPLAPYGSVDQIHVENGDAITVDINFYDVDLSNIEYNLNIPVTGPWWSPDQDYTIPGGTYIGGHFEVKLKINGVQVDSKTGSIVDPE